MAVRPTAAETLGFASKGEPSDAGLPGTGRPCPFSGSYIARGCGFRVDDASPPRFPPIVTCQRLNVCVGALGGWHLR